jgi:CBS-domain-containing membrane protein
MEGVPGRTCFMSSSSKHVYCSCIYAVRCVMCGAVLSSYVMPQSVRVHMYVAANSSASAVVLFGRIGSCSGVIAL